MKPLPAKSSLPLLGDTIRFALDPAGLLERRAAELGPVFQISLFGHPTVCFSGDAFALLLDDANIARTGANPPHVEKIFNPQAVPFLDGPAQRRRKNLLMHAFREAALEGYLPAIEQIIARYAKRWSALGEFSWVPELEALGFAVAGTLFAGKSAAQDDPSLGEAFNKVAAGLLSLPINLPFTNFGKALRARDFLLGVVEGAIADQQKNGTSSTNVIARLLEARDGDEKLSNDELRIELFHFFGAYSAVIGGLAFLMMWLGRKPDVAERARQELAENLPSGPLTLAAVKKLPYLDRITKEVRRASTVLPITFFGTVVRNLEYKGMNIPKGHRALGCIGLTTHDATTFADPDAFDPERWLNPTPEQQRAWIPHGGGVHSAGHRCAGEELATLMMKVLAIHLLRGYTWQLSPDQDFSPTKNKLFATPVGGLRVCVSANA